MGIMLLTPSPDAPHLFTGTVGVAKQSEPNAQTEVSCAKAGSSIFCWCSVILVSFSVGDGL